jgi:hypothetical protein
MENARNEVHRIGLVRAHPDYWVCLCAEGKNIKSRSVVACGRCGARRSRRYPATLEDARKYIARRYKC